MYTEKEICSCKFVSKLRLQFSSQVTINFPRNFRAFNAWHSRVTSYFVFHPPCLIIRVPANARKSLLIKIKNIDRALVFDIFLGFNTKEGNDIIPYGSSWSLKSFQNNINASVWWIIFHRWGILYLRRYFRQMPTLCIN